MKKIYLVVFTIFALSIPTQSANITENETSVYLTISHHDHKHKNHHHDRKNRDPRKDRQREIEYKLDLLDAKYKRDKDRIEHSNMDKNDQKFRKKELEYQYKREKDRLKYEKKMIKKAPNRPSGFYNN